MIKVETNLSAGIKKVWDCYTQPEHITRWNFASDGWQCPHAENDLRVGGNYLVRMEAKDGSFGFDFHGIYNEIIEHQKLSYVLDDGRRVTTTFKENGGLINVITAFDPDKENPEDLQQQGWQAILNNFKKHVEL